jgi:hypothetical protein
MKRSLFIAPQRMPIKCYQCKEEFIPNGVTGEICLSCVVLALNTAVLKIADLEKKLEEAKSPKLSNASNNYYKATSMRGTGDDVVDNYSKMNSWGTWK